MVNFAAAGLCWVLQLIIEPTQDNLLCATLSAITVVVTSAYCFQQRLIQNHLWSVLALYGACLESLGIALFGMTSEWRPLTYNLYFPVLTFGSGLVVMLICITAHAFYVNNSLMRVCSSKLRDVVYRPLGLLRVPSDLELWLLGALGVVAILLSSTGDQLYGANGVKAGDVGGKFMQGLVIFSIAPYVIAFKSGLASNKVKVPAMTWAFLAVYTVLMLGLAIARNARYTFAQIILMSLVCGAAMLLKGSIKVTSKTLAIGMVLLALGVPAAEGFSYLSGAIRVVRNERNSLSTLALVGRTLDVMGQPALIEYEKDHEDIATTGYDEVYFKSEFLLRLAMTKYMDIAWTAVGGFPEVNQTLHDRAMYNFNTHVLGLLPTPILNKFHIDIDKQSVEFLSSTGDYYLNFASMKDMGGFVTGSVIPDSYVLFGVLAPFFLFAIFSVAFIILDSFLVFDSKGNVYMLACSIIIAPPLFAGFLLPEGCSVYFQAILRILPQPLIFYAIVTQGTHMAFNWVARPTGGQGRRPVSRLLRRGVGR